MQGSEKQFCMQHEGPLTKGFHVMHVLMIVVPEKPPIDPKTRTYYGQVGSARPADRPGGVGQDWVPTALFAQETKVPRTFQGIEKASL